jgi:hypothetical protein
VWRVLAWEWAGLWGSERKEMGKWRLTVEGECDRLQRKIG